MNSTVLLVEDDQTLRYLAGEVLSMMGTHVIECTCADDALEVLHGPDKIDLVVTDIRMPGLLDGHELAQFIWEFWPDLPVILTSGHRHLDQNALPKNSAFVAKPWSLDQLQAAVQQRLVPDLRVSTAS